MKYKEKNIGRICKMVAECIRKMEAREIQRKAKEKWEMRRIEFYEKGRMSEKEVEDSSRVVSGEEAITARKLIQQLVLENSTLMVVSKEVVKR